MNKVAITGATGFIGGALSKLLLNKGVKVYGIGIDINKLNLLCEQGDFVPIAASFNEYDSLSEKLPYGEIDVFYHFAWQGLYGEYRGDYELQLSNAKYACDAVMQAIKAGCRKFVFANTCSYFEIKSFMNDDDFKPRNQHIYAMAKTSADLISKTIAHKNNLLYCSSTISMAYGEYSSSQNLANIVIKKLLQNISPKLITGNSLYDLLYITDTARALEAIGQAGIDKKTYYVGNRVLKTFKEQMTAIRDIVNPNVELLFGKYPDLQQIDYSLIDLDALYNDTGFEAKADFAESIRKTADWLKTTLND